MTGSRNFLLALAAAILAPFALVLLPNNPAPPRGIAAAEAALPSAISAADAASHVGESATVEGTAHVHTARSGSATFIDLDGVYPDNPFSAVIFEDDRAAVGDVSAFEGRAVGISGEIQMYRDKPQIVVSSRNQIVAR
jgi:hypothetical protein